MTNSEGATPASPDAEGPPVAPVAVIAAHGDLAAGLVSAVEQITGRGALFIPLSNRDLSATELEARIESHLARGVHVVFTDLPAGSTTICARRLQRVLHAFVGRETALACVAFAPTPNHGSADRETRVHDAGFHHVAKGALHR